MSMFLYAIGAICVVAGAAMAAFGIPVSEFSFGNTLILTGAVTAVGGLIVIGLAVVASRLQQLVEAGYGQEARAFEAYEGTPARAASGRIPFPPRPRPEPKPEPKADFTPETARAPLPAAIAPAVTPAREETVAQSLAPTLPNPDEPVTVAENVTLSPQHPNGGSIESGDFDHPHDERAPEREEEKAAFDKEWPAEPAPAAEKRGAFSFMWPERKTAEKPAPVRDEAPTVEAAPPEPVHEAEPTPELAPEAAHEDAAPPAEAPRNVAVLKSGVVDGMGYTLYVDGSIEAELPQGTLRFASINELRAHLEQNA